MRYCPSQLSAPLLLNPGGGSVMHENGHHPTATGEILGQSANLLLRDNGTVDHVVSVVTEHFLSHLHPRPDEDELFAVWHRPHRAAALAVSFRTGHLHTLFGGH